MTSLIFQDLPSIYEDFPEETLDSWGICTQVVENYIPITPVFSAEVFDEEWMPALEEEADLVVTF